MLDASIIVTVGTGGIILIGKNCIMYTEFILKI